MLFVNSLQILLLLLFILEKVGSILFPNSGLLLIDLLFIDLFLSFLIDLPGQIFSHETFLLLLGESLPFFLLFLFFELVFNMPHHFLILSSDLLLLILNHRISKACHDCLDLLLSLFLLLLSFLLEFILQSGVLLLSADILNLLQKVPPIVIFRLPLLISFDSISFRSWLLWIYWALSFCGRGLLVLPKSAPLWFWWPKVNRVHPPSFFNVSFSSFRLWLGDLSFASPIGSFFRILLSFLFIFDHMFWPALLGVWNTHFALSIQQPSFSFSLTFVCPTPSSFFSWIPLLSSFRAPFLFWTIRCQTWQGLPIHRHHPLPHGKHSLKQLSWSRMSDLIGGIACLDCLFLIFVVSVGMGHCFVYHRFCQRDPAYWQLTALIFLK